MPDQSFDSSAHCARKPPLLSVQEMENLLPGIPGWGLAGARLARDFSLDGFDQTVRLVNAVCDIARREDHHPQVMFDFKHIRVEFWTHTAGGVTRNDFICAKQLNTWMENNT